MRDQEIIGLWEAYQQVHAQPEEVEQLDEIKQATTVANDKIPNFQNGKKAKPVPGLNVPPSPMEEGVDLFDYLLEYLIAEGYADTNKAALAIMANMSEEWKQSILNEDPVQDYRDMQRAKRDRPLSRDDSGLTDYGAGGGAAAEAKGIPRAAVIKQGAINRANLEKNNKPEKPGPSNNFGRGF